MRFQLVLQFPEKDLSFDRLVQIEEMLMDAVGEEAEVDGHDMGSGESNIFIKTDDPEETFRTAKALLEDEDEFRVLKAAYREKKAGGYSILWPKGLNSFKVA